MKKIISVILAAIMIFVAFCSLNTVIVADSTAAEVASGSCGNGISWSYYDDGSVHFVYQNGGDNAGVLSDFESQTYAEWQEYISYDGLSNIYLPEGLTRIGNYYFYIRNLSNVSVTEITIPSTVTSIGEYAFKNFKSLKTITFTGSAPEIAATAFTGCGTKECPLVIRYPSSDSSWEKVTGNNYGANSVTWGDPITKNSMSLNGNILTLTPKTGTEISGRVYVAEYDADGTMTELSSYEAKETVQISAFSSDMSQYCIMWVDGAGAPLADAVTGAINS